jgi:hypothetical protein
MNYPGIWPCKNCGKTKEEHFTNVTPYRLCQDIKAKKIGSKRYIPVDNLTFIEERAKRRNELPR